MTIAYGPPRHWKAIEKMGMSQEDYSTKLRKDAIFVSDCFGLFFICCFGGVIGIIAHHGELSTLFSAPGGIAGIAIGGLGVIISVVPRVVEHIALQQGKIPPLYGKGGTRNDCLYDASDSDNDDVEEGKGGIHDVIIGGEEEEDNESEFTPLTPTSRKSRKGGGSFNF